MSTSKPPPFLPPDLILYIVEFLIPPPSDTKVAYESSHAITRTLLTLTRTSRITYPIARRLLYSHCLYIDSPHRLHCFLSSLTAYAAESKATTSPLESKPAGIHHPTSLYLSSFVNDTINDFPTTQAILSLLSLLSPTLHRLVIDIPLRSLYPEDDTLGVRRILHDAFAKLTSLEVFCSARDELFLNYTHEWTSDGGGVSRWRAVNVWPRWPKLRTLVLYNCDLGSENFWRGMGAMKNLETLVLTRADGVREVDFGREWERCGNGGRGVTVWFVDIDGGRGIPEIIEEAKEGGKVKVMVGRVPTSYYGDEGEIELCQDWIKRSVLRGESGLQKELMHLSTQAAERE